MVLFLRESDVETLASMKMALEALDEAFRLQGQGKADNAPRRRSRLQQGLHHVMSASLPTLRYSGLKSYTSVAGKTRFHVFLYGGDEGRLLAIIEADRLGQIRTGAASGIATKLMARGNASRLGIIGTGWQARSQVEAIGAVRSLQTVLAYGRDPERRERFCREMTEKLGIGVYPASTAAEAVKEADIVTTITTSKEPVFKGEWLRAGTHVNAAGSNFLSKQEVDVETVRRAACVIVDSLEQSRIESGDLARAAEAEAFYWEDARELGQVVCGEFPGRESDDEITLFKSNGIALEDVALAARVYEDALEAGVGENLPI